MGKKQERVALAEQQLAAKIDRLVLLRPQANEYRLLCDQVKEELMTRAEEKREEKTAAGNTAHVTRKPQFGWILASLKTALSRGVFETLCPRKPDAKKLDQRLAAMPEDKALAKCKIEGNAKYELEVLAAGETVCEKHDDDAE